MSEKLNARELAINYLQYISANSEKILNEAEYLRKLIETAGRDSTLLKNRTEIDF